MNFGKFDIGKNSGFKNDRCNEMDCKDFDSQDGAPLKYYTTNFFKEGIKNDAGINFQEGFGISSSFIDRETMLKRSVITNPKIRQNFGQLPLTTLAGLPKSSGPVIAEGDSREKKSCQPQDNHFYDRSFYSIDKNPNAVQSSTMYRQGLDTRNDFRTEYKK